MNYKSIFCSRNQNHAINFLLSPFPISFCFAHRGETNLEAQVYKMTHFDNINLINYK
ncbi:hypothetical protein HMPREF3041_05292 [Escherichia coli]|nr:hypothetical protein HMPREF1603_04641 [Escherichia coli 907892]KXG88636.1 hypothetical protein HMPREF3041_05292 [Escherichia coli]